MRLFLINCSSICFLGVFLIPVPRITAVDLCNGRGTSNQAEDGCYCNGHFYGKTCQQIYCQNGGRVAVGMGGLETCTCPPETVGMACETSIIDTSDLMKKLLSCFHGQYDGETETCVCDSKWSGKNCDKIECHNGGTRSTFGSVCKCRGGFTGTYCHLRVVTDEYDSDPAEREYDDGGSHDQVVFGVIIFMAICGCVVYGSVRFCHSQPPPARGPLLSRPVVLTSTTTAQPPPGARSNPCPAYQQTSHAHPSPLPSGEDDPFVEPPPSYEDVCRNNQ